MEIQISQMSRNLQIGAHRPVTSLDNISEIYQRLDEMQSRNDAVLRDEFARLSHKVDQLVQPHVGQNSTSGLEQNQQLPQFDTDQSDEVDQLVESHVGQSSTNLSEQKQQLPLFVTDQELEDDQTVMQPSMGGRSSLLAEKYRLL